jgi:hypothetical protein
MTLGAKRANGALIVSTPSFFAGAGTSGTFDVVLANTGAGAIDIAGFSFGISTTNAGITFTGATIFTGVPYIFSADSLFGPDITITSGTSLRASDNPFIASSFPVASGATVGLGHVSYSIFNSAAAGPFAITLTPAATSLADAAGANVPIDSLSNGTLTVNSSVPEPVTYGLVGMVLILGLARKMN